MKWGELEEDLNIYNQIYNFLPNLMTEKDACSEPQVVE